jgi:lysozyme
MEQEARDWVKARLKLDEGWKEYAYQDSLGFWTIGWGFQIDRKAGGTLPVPVAEVWLENKVSEKEQQLEQHAWYTCQDNVRKAALLNMAFNLGVDKLLTFPIFLGQMAHGDYEGAAKNLEGTRWHVQVGPRADRIIALIRTGKWP